MSETKIIPALENLLALELYASEASFFAHGSEALSIVLTSHRFDNSVSPAEQRRVVVARLVMPISGAQGLAVGLYDYLKKAGLDPAPVPVDPTKLQ